MSDIRFFLEGFRQDLKREKENLEQFYRDYLQLNSEIGAKKDRYESLLLNFSTEELKFTLGFLTNVYRNIDRKKHTVVDSIFDAVEHSGEFKLTVFYGNRILEKYSSKEIEDFLIRIYTIRRVLNALIIIDDRLEYLKFLLIFMNEIEQFYDRFPLFTKENLRNSTDFYQFMYIYSLKISGNEEEALGFLIKGYNIKRLMIQEKIINYPEENNLFQIINIVGSYLQLEDSFISLIIEIDEYIKEFVKQIKDLKNYSLKKPSVLQPYLSNPFKKYINQFLTNIYILGFEEEYYQVAQILPEIITKEHQLVIRINEILLKENHKEEKIKKIKEDIEKAFNNFSHQKKEKVLYVYYNAYISIFREKIEEIEKIFPEIEKHIKKLKNPVSLYVPLFRALNILGEKEKALKIAEETKINAQTSGKKFLARAVDDYIKAELY
ncbi:hypothetical protein GWK41_01065 [Persephonella atlantica]|uniref:Uncharacterized protein n=1 Tax=Persephonella atlantica TaxID=2699429 RepID=A0ABS1GFF2_9AQUI|nr:hypothetical protein [Persephonella atlantica]MBK3331652.1 hypothetical protein [Persephonella atlantica]